MWEGPPLAVCVAAYHPGGSGAVRRPTADGPKWILRIPDWECEASTPRRSFGFSGRDWIAIRAAPPP
ncbi:hypothetical protein CGMCC3_g1251 [Colletotrichum fructicola]|nr:uncharacterized protein CGMCC3_g1251 [Colletotrichum fructicola]KAE9583304.1 hypothetical protein CGMCC3_g1251 [Colletotrichum fructicola]